MRKIYQKLLVLVCFVVMHVMGFAQESFFTHELSAPKNLPANLTRAIVPKSFNLFSVSNTQLRAFLWSLPSEGQFQRNHNVAPVMVLPMPDGSTAAFHVWESSIQEPGLAAKFPEIKTFAGQGIDDPYATVRFDYSPYFGFRAQILSAATGRIYIDPYVKGNIDNCISYYQRDYSRSDNFHCQNTEMELLNRNGVNTSSLAGPCRGTQLATYRLAISCTGEYAQAVGGALPGPTHAAVVTSINRITGVYEVELAIRLVLIANNNLIEYLDGTTDPFSNVIGSALLNANQTNTDAVIGSANYDIGHIFTSDDNGLAQLGCVCQNGAKARGATGSPSLIGDGFDIDYVAHEMGHQFGAPHTFNSAQCASPGGSYEPGGGTTIMAYAGICGASDNIQPNSDAIFHPNSFDAISNYLQGQGGNCPVVTATGNTLPVITSMGTNNLSIPINTPFTLTGSATDADGDAITYNWDGWDVGPAGTWLSAATSTTRPLFRTRVSKVSGSRTFPDIRVIAANYPGNGAPSAMDGLRGEVLPTVARTMKFRLTVRDNRAGGGGVVSAGDGCQGTAIFQVNAVGTVPFAVTVPNGGESYPGGSTQTVTWNTASSDLAPINVANVKITLSTDGGLTYPTVILASTANDGTESVTIPAVPSTTTARVRVEAIGNIFFDISNANFSITAPASTFTFNSLSASTSSCPAPATMSSTLQTNSLGGFNTPINLSATSGVPAGTSVSFSTNPVVPGASTVITLNNANTLAFGTYNITIQGVSGSITQTTTASFVINAGVAPTITTQPVATTVCAGTNAIFTVTATGATSYQWQVSTDGGTTYTNIAAATGTSYTVTAPTAAQNNNRYRVIVNGQCGTTTSSAAILTVNTAPAISAQPQNVSTCAGSNAVFNVTASGAGLAYQWQISTDGGGSYTNIAGANAASYTATAVTTTMNNYRYRVIITGSCTPAVTSSGAILSVGTTPVITGQPAAQVVCVGATPSFTVTATGSSLTYQWQVSTDGGGTFSNVSGATSATLSLPAVTAGQNGSIYRVQVAGCVATPVTSSNALLTVNTPISIGTQPTDQTLCSGSNATFNVAASGTGASYQWQVSTDGGNTWNNIAGATSTSYTATAVNAGMNNNRYRVIVNGACGPVTSSAVLLTVNIPVTISAQPSNSSVCVPNGASFSVTAAGTNVTYQWQLSTNGGTSFTDIAGATSSTLTIPPVTATMNGYVYHVVLNGTCTSNLVSSNAVLTVNEPVALIVPPVATAVCAGNSTSFTVVTGGNQAGYAYQWQVSTDNGVTYSNIAGATSSSYNTPVTTLSMNGYLYRVNITRTPCGSLTTTGVPLTVNVIPTVAISASGSTSINPGTRVTLTATPAPAGTYTYVWLRNGLPVTNATGNSLVVDVDGLGQYTVVATNTATHCFSTAAPITVSASGSNLLFVYPSPSNGRFSVRYYDATAGTTTVKRTLNVYDAHGARVYSQVYDINSPYTNMDVSMLHMASGIYMVDVRDASGTRIAIGKVMIR